MERVINMAGIVLSVVALIAAITCVGGCTTSQAIYNANQTYAVTTERIVSAHDLGIIDDQDLIEIDPIEAEAYAALVALRSAASEAEYRLNLQTFNAAIDRLLIYLTEREHGRSDHSGDHEGADGAGRDADHRAARGDPGGA